VVASSTTVVITQPSKLTTMACCDSLVNPVLCAANVSPPKTDSRSRGSAALLRFFVATCPSPNFRKSPAFSLCGRKPATRCQRGFHLLREIGVATSEAWQGLDSLRSHLNPPRAWGHSRLIQLDTAQRGPGMGMSNACKGTCSLAIENIRIAWAFVRVR